MRSERTDRQHGTAVLLQLYSSSSAQVLQRSCFCMLYHIMTSRSCYAFLLLFMCHPNSFTSYMYRTIYVYVNECSKEYYSSTRERYLNLRVPSSAEKYKVGSGFWGGQRQIQPCLSCHQRQGEQPPPSSSASRRQSVLLCTGREETQCGVYIMDGQNCAVCVYHQVCRVQTDTGA